MHLLYMYLTSQWYCTCINMAIHTVHKLPSYRTQHDLDTTDASTLNSTGFCMFTYTLQDVWHCLKQICRKMTAGRTTGFAQLAIKRGVAKVGIYKNHYYGLSQRWYMYMGTCIPVPNIVIWKWLSRWVNCVVVLPLCCVALPFSALLEVIVHIQTVWSIHCYCALHNIPCHHPQYQHMLPSWAVWQQSPHLQLLNYRYTSDDHPTQRVRWRNRQT